ncbi:MAG: T9SS type A sorting domain-containing protein, partial [Salinivirgaceae bacterium]
LTIEIGEKQAQRFSLTDLTGRVVLNKENPSKIETIDVGKLSDGIYMLNIQTNNKSISTRIVIQ